MPQNIDKGMIINYVMGLLLDKIVVPSDYHEQVDACKTMLKDDVTGLVDSLTDFAIESAAVEYSIETKSDKFTKMLKEWFDKLNISFNGQVPIGIKALSKEYFKERWKYSSFPVLKINKWGKVGDLMVPTELFFIDSQIALSQTIFAAGRPALFILRSIYFLSDGYTFSRI